MAIATGIELVGVLTATPATPSIYSTSVQELLPLSFCATYGATKNAVVPIASSAPSPFVVPFEGITKARLFAIRLLSGATMTLKITTAEGEAVIPVSGQFLWHSPAPGDEATLIKLVGTGDVAYVLSGDVS